VERRKGGALKICIKVALCLVMSTRLRIHKGKFHKASLKTTEESPAEKFPDLPQSKETFEF
jgi:hypothetical protein